MPAYNEAGRVGSVVRQALIYLPVVVIDDGSTDETAVEAEAAGALVLRQIPNQGKGAALRAGFRWAIEQGYEAVLTLDADGQHDPAEIPKFLQTYQETPADLVIGRRKFSQMPLTRRLANWLARVSFSWALGRFVPDNQSGYRLISRRLMKALLVSHEAGFEYEVEMIVICVRHNFRLAWVPIQTIYAGEVSHIHPVQHVIKFLRLLWHTRWSRAG